MKPAHQVCSNCVFFVPSSKENVNYGCCHRYPVFAVNRPTIHFTDWCGEFKGKTRAQNSKTEVKP